MLGEPSEGELPAGLAAEISSGRLAELFDLLSDQSRAGILYALLEAGELSVSDLTEWTGDPPHRASDALRVLRTARVVNSRRSGESVTYHLGGDHVRRLLEVAASAVESRRLWQLRHMEAGSLTPPGSPTCR